MNVNSSILIQSSDLNEWTSISTGNFNGASVFNGQLYTWGPNIAGQIGNGTLEEQLEPLLITNCTLNTAETKKRDLRVFPNPSQGIFNIGLSNDQVIQSFHVTDMLGRTIINEVDFIGAVDLSTFARGSYILYVQTSSNVSLRQILVKE